MLAFLEKYKKIDMLEGSLWDKILVFSIPLALTSFLQQLFNTADVVILGHYVNDNAMAAVGNNVPVIGFIVALFVGMSIGANVVVARYLGMKDEENAKDAVNTSFSVAIIIGILFCILGEFFVPQITELMDVPDEVKPESIKYLRAYFLGLPFISIYNFEAALLRSNGDTHTPLIALIYASILNIAGNLVCVLFFQLGIGGVALCTSLANALSALYLFRKILNAEGPISLDLRKLMRLNSRKLRAIVAIGLPTGIQGIVFSISNLVIQSSINSLGADAMAASAAAFTIEINIYCFINAFGLAATTFIGQNFGAKNIRRCVEIAKVSSLIGLIVTTVITAGVYFFAKPLLSMYTVSEAVISIAMIRIFYVLLPQPINIFLEVLSGSMRGYGFSLPPTIITLLTICSCRLLYVFTVFEKFTSFDVLMMVYPLSWVICIVFLVVMYIYKIRKVEKEYSRLYKSKKA